MSDIMAAQRESCVHRADSERQKFRTISLNSFARSRFVRCPETRNGTSTAQTDASSRIGRMARIIASGSWRPRSVISRCSVWRSWQGRLAALQPLAPSISMLAARHGGRVRPASRQEHAPATAEVLFEWEEKADVNPASLDARVGAVVRRAGRKKAALVRTRSRDRRIAYGVPLLATRSPAMVPAPVVRRVIREVQTLAEGHNPVTVLAEISPP
jgi:hypothetical protein